MSNKNAATENEIGKLHDLITRCHNMKAGYMLEIAQGLLKAGAAPDDIVKVINSRDLASMQKWVEYNGVGCTLEQEDETSELSKKLKKLRESQEGKIVQFKDAEGF